MGCACDEQLGDALSALVEQFRAATRVDYRQLAEALRDEIANERIKVGAQLPSQRELAGLLAVGRGTVVGAYNVLLGESIIRMRPGAGTWVVARPEDRSRPPAP